MLCRQNEFEEKLHRVFDFLSCYADRPWLIAWSGGKDSTAVLLLVLEYLSHGQFPEPPSVVLYYHDTLVEPPLSYEWVYTTLIRIIEQFGDKVRVIVDVPENDFLRCVLELGYTAPSGYFRWCETELKVKVERHRFSKLSRYVLLLGVRKAESVIRNARVEERAYVTGQAYIQKKLYNGNILHVAPIVDWSTDEVLQYITSRLSMLNVSINKLLKVYLGYEPDKVTGELIRYAFAIRTGCWVCTVIMNYKRRYFRDQLLERYARFDPRYNEVLEVKKKFVELSFDKKLREESSKRFNVEGRRRVAELFLKLFMRIPELALPYLVHKPRQLEKWYSDYMNVDLYCEVCSAVEKRKELCQLRELMYEVVKSCAVDEIASIAHASILAGGSIAVLMSEYYTGGAMFGSVSAPSNFSGRDQQRTNDC